MSASTTLKLEPKECWIGACHRIGCGSSGASTVSNRPARIWGGMVNRREQFSWIAGGFNSSPEAPQFSPRTASPPAHLVSIRSFDYYNCEFGQGGSMRNEGGCAIDQVRRAIENQVTYLEDTLEGIGAFGHRTPHTEVIDRQQRWACLIERLIAVCSCAEADRGAAAILRGIGYGEVIGTMIAAIRSELDLPLPLGLRVPVRLPEQLSLFECSSPSNTSGPAESRMKSAA